MLASRALSHCLEYALTRLADMIETGKYGVDQSILMLRASFFTLVNNLPITCKDLLQEAAQNVAFEYILYYERIRLGRMSPHYFLEGLPNKVHLFVGHTTVSLSGKQKIDAERAKVRDVFSDRRATVDMMESMPPDSERKIELTTKHTANLPLAIPGPVRFLVARSRAVMKTLRQAKRTDLFANCANCQCSRLFYKGEPSENWPGAEMRSINTQEDRNDINSELYWKSACDWVRDPVSSNRKFCSSVCASQHAYHLQMMMPDAGIHLDADDAAKSVERKRVGESFSLALKRNGTVARALRTARSRHRSMRMTVSEAELETHREKRIMALNVDLGLLYAASVIADSANLCTRRILPGQCIYWRDNPMLYAKPLKTIKKIYNNTKRKEGIVSSLLTMPRFLENIRVKAHVMF